MLTIIKASLLGSALMLLASCTGYLTNYQTPCVQGTSANVYGTRRCTGAGSTAAITEESNHGLTKACTDKIATGDSDLINVRWATLRTKLVEQCRTALRDRADEND